MSDIELKAYSFNLTLKSDDFIDYIFSILKQNFPSYSTISGIALSIKAFKDNNGNKSYLKPHYDDSSSEEKLKSTFITDNDLFFPFYKNSKPNSIFVITSDNKNIYSTLENSMANCKVIHLSSIENYLETYNKSTNNTLCNDCNVTNCPFLNNKKPSTNDLEWWKNNVLNIDSNFKKCNATRVIINYEKLLLPIHDWVIIAFPFFFINKFIGTYGIIMKNHFDHSFIESYIKFLRKANINFNRGLVNHIFNDWKQNNPNSKFCNLLSYFIDIEKLTNFPNINDSFKKIEKNDYKIYYPILHENNTANKFLLLSINEDKNNDSPKYYKYHIRDFDDNNSFNIQQETFELISHIQWLWDLWQNYEVKHNNKNN